MNQWPDHPLTGPDEHSPVAEWARFLIDTVCDNFAAWLYPITGAATVPLLLITPPVVIGLSWLTATRVARHRTQPESESMSADRPTRVDAGN